MRSVWVAALFVCVALGGCSDESQTAFVDYLIPNPQWEIVTAHPHNASCTTDALCRALDLRISTRISNDTSAEYVDFIYSGRSGDEGLDADQWAVRVDGPDVYRAFKVYDVTVWFPKAFAWDGRQMEVRVDGPT